MKFIEITLTQADSIAADPYRLFTSCYRVLNTNAKQYLYYDENNDPNAITLTDTQLDGLTPINPTKPMFPKKK